MGTLALTEAAARMRRPAKVKQIMDRVLALDLTAMPRSAKDVLLYLASLVNLKDPAAPVYPKRSTIARETGLSEPTVYRLLSRLERDGWIQREAQQLDAGRFGEASIHLNPDLVGIAPDSPSDVPAPKETPKHEPEPPTITLTAPYTEDRKALKKTSNGLRPASVEKQVRLPAALCWIVDSGRLTAQQVLALMSDAKRRGVWLQDVLDAKRAAIESGRIAIRNLYALLRYLVGTDTDWIRVRQDRCERIEQERNMANNANRREAWAARVAGGTYAHTDGRMFRFLASGRFAEIYGREGDYIGAVPLETKLIDALEAGRIRPLT